MIRDLEFYVKILNFEKEWKIWIYLPIIFYTMEWIKVRKIRFIFLDIFIHYADSSTYIEHSIRFLQKKLKFRKLNNHCIYLLYTNLKRKTKTFALNILIHSYIPFPKKIKILKIIYNHQTAYIYYIQICTKHKIKSRLLWTFWFARTSCLHSIEHFSKRNSEKIKYIIYGEGEDTILTFAIPT